MRWMVKGYTPKSFIACNNAFMMLTQWAVKPSSMTIVVNKISGSGVEYDESYLLGCACSALHQISLDYHWKAKWLK